jgi:hypothetical protein
VCHPIGCRSLCRSRRPPASRSAPTGVVARLVRHLLRVVCTTTRNSAVRPSVRSEDRPAAPAGFVALSGFGLKCPPWPCLARLPLLGFHAPSAASAEGSASPGFASPGTFRPRGFSPPRRVLLPPALRTRWVRCRSWGSRSCSSFERRGREYVAALPASLRLRCSTASDSEEYEVESSADSKTLEPIRPGSTAVVPEPPSPLRSTSSSSRHGSFRPRSSPLALEPSASGRTMTLRAGAPGCSNSPRTGGSTRDPQLPWGFRCIRKTLWRPPMLDFGRYRHTRRSWKFSGVRDPLQTPGPVARAARPSHVTGLSKNDLSRAAVSSFPTRGIATGRRRLARRADASPTA